MRKGRQQLPADQLERYCQTLQLRGGVAALRWSGDFNDYDSIEVGNGSNDGLTPVERQTQISLWALGSAPFILGVDLTHLDPTDLQNT